MKKPLPLRGRRRLAQQGVMLLEALIGILIFSLGVLALVAMQSVSISNVSNAKYRVEAAFFADEILNRIWMDSYGTTGMANQNLVNVNNYQYPGGSAPYLVGWVSRIQAPATGLPGANTFPPVIRVQPVGGGGGAPQAMQVTVQIFWRAPEAITTSNHIAIGVIADP